MKISAEWALIDAESALINAEIIKLMMKINAEIINPYFPRVPLGRGLPLPHTPSPEPNLRAPAHLTPPSGSLKGSQKVFKKVLMERIKKVAQT